MNDQREAFERDLKAKLAIDPSSDLQARIRARAFSAPAKRAPWFAWTSGLAAAAAAVILVVIYIQPKSPENIAPAFPKAAVTPPVAPSPAAIRPTKSPAPVRTKQPVLIEIPAAAAVSAGLNPGRIEIPPLHGLEVTNSLEPLPQAPVLSIATIEPINIEPLTLAVRNLGVNE